MSVKQNHLGKLIGVLFGLFFVVGGFMILSETAIPTLKDWHIMQSWSSTSAQLLEVSGRENETIARYKYQIGGVTYYGDRVYVSLMKDNIGSYHSDLYNRLNRQKNSGRSILIWVNPADPGQAVIDRNMRWVFFVFMCGFCSIFIVIGLLIVYVSLSPNKKISRNKEPSLSELRKEWEKKIQDSNFTPGFIEYRDIRISELRQETRKGQSNGDWRLRKGWRTSTIRSKVKYTLLVSWVFAAVFSVAGLVMMFSVVPEAFAKEDYWALLLMLFPVAALFLLYKAVVTTLEYLRFGTVFFEMDPYPGSIGGHIGGKVEITQLVYDVASDQSTILTVRLECVYSYMTRSGKNRRREERIRWVEEGMPRIENKAKGVALVFRFDVPDDLPESDIEQTDSYHYWRLTVKAVVQGVDLFRQYNIPVFKTAEQSRFVRHDISAQLAAIKEEKSEATKQSIALGDFDSPGLSRSMRLDKKDDEITMSFPMFRNKGLTIVIGILAGGFSFASYSMIGLVGSGGFAWLSAFFILPFALVAILATLATVFILFDNLRVSISTDYVTVLRRLLFIPTIRRQISVNEIAHLSVQRSGSSGQGVDKIVHYRLRLHDRQGKSLTIAEDLDGKDVAIHFCDFLAQHLNVESQ